MALSNFDSSICAGTELDNAEHIKQLQDLVGTLQSELSAEKSARVKERKVLKDKVDYETARHIYYKRLYHEQLATENPCKMINRSTTVLPTVSVSFLLDAERVLTFFCNSSGLKNDVRLPDVGSENAENFGTGDIF
jgi:hypothetical protein